MGSKIVLFELGYRTLISVIDILGYTIVHSDIFQTLIDDTNCYFVSIRGFIS